MTARVVLDAHRTTVNGCRAIDPSVDDATSILHQAHAVLSLAIDANEGGVFSKEMIGEAFRAAETLLGTGVRNLIVGHEQLLKMTRQ